METMFEKTGLNYNKEFGFNVLPLNGKIPINKWEHWQNVKQMPDDIKNMYWDNATGLGAVMGINNLRSFDLDKVEDIGIVKMLLKELRLPEDYEWVVQSGSGEGFHIYFRCIPTPSSPPWRGNNAQKGEGIFDSEKAVYKFKMREEGLCKHIELRWKDCQNALPPSNHESGGIYDFKNIEPTELPALLELNNVVECLNKYCAVEEQKAHTPAFAKASEGKPTLSPRKRDRRRAREKATDKVYYDKDKLESAIKYLTEKLPGNSYEEWYKIGFALIPLGEAGENYFIEMSLNNPNYNDSEYEIRNKFNSLKEDYDGRVTLGTLFHIAELNGWKKPVVKFWNKDENGKLTISRTRYKNFLEGEGFCKYKIDNNYFIVRIENNIIDEVSIVDIKEFVMSYLDQIPIEELGGSSKAEITDALLKSHHQLFTQQFLEFLITKNITFNKDTKTKGYFYYKNGFVEVTSTERKFFDYTKLKNCIWKKPIVNRDYAVSNRRSVMEELLFNICRKDINRYKALKSGIGYLLHSYKDPSNAKSIIFIDEKLSEGAFGRSGKGLVIKGISQVKSVVILDGRNFNPSKNFAFQRVKADTEIIAIEDIGEKFPFDRLFSIITEGITIEKKNKDEFFIPFNESPKLVLSSNFTLSGVDDSTVDRQFIIEFSDYYNKNHCPVDDFGKLLFEGWDENEWRDFDYFMIECLQGYLKNGLLTYEFANYEKKKLIDSTSEEFAEFSVKLVPGEEFNKKELFDEFKREYEYNDKFTQGKFTKWMKLFGRIKNYEIAERKSGSKRTLEYIDKEKKEAA